MPVTLTSKVTNIGGGRSSATTRRYYRAERENGKLKPDEDGRVVRDEIGSGYVVNALSRDEKHEHPLRLSQDENTEWSYWVCLDNVQITCPGVTVSTMPASMSIGNDIVMSSVPNRVQYRNSNYSDPVPEGWNALADDLVLDRLSIFGNGDLYIDIDTWLQDTQFNSDYRTSERIVSVLNPAITYKIEISSENDSITVFFTGDFADTRFTPVNYLEVIDFLDSLVNDAEGAVVITNANEL